MKILIVGCGYLGKALGKNLAESGHTVWGLRRDLLALKSLEMVGIKPFQADLLKPETLLRLPEVDAVVLCQAPSKSTDDPKAVYVDGTHHLIEAFHFKKPKKLILISSTGVYPTHDGSWVDEETDIRESNAKDLVEAEELVLSGLIPGLVLRLGGIYGPWRHRLKAMKEGKIKPSISDRYVNRIHVDDAVNGIKLLLEKGKPGEIYLGVDDHPSTEEEFYSWIDEKLLIKKFADESTVAESRLAPNKRCSNKKMKALGWTLKYPSFREGYLSLLTSGLAE